MKYTLTDKGEYLSYSTSDALAWGVVKSTTLLGALLLVLRDKPLSLRELSNELREPEGNVLRELDLASKTGLVVQIP